MKIIYIACPAYFVTGGTELLHQLAFSINKMQPGRAILYYCKVLKDSGKNVTAPPFEKYIAETMVVTKFEEVLDVQGNVLVVPEVFTTLIPFFSSLKIWIWWLSVDNFFLSNGYSRNSKLLNYIRDADLQLYQSEYAKRFLSNRRITEKMPLSDFLNDVFFNTTVYNTVERLSVVAYNPLKGFDFTKLLIMTSPDIIWVPIENMSAKEVVGVLKKAKVYIDFGTHPGKDRIPREAAIQGCCIIIGKNGAAQNSIDIPISNRYKFDTHTRNIPRIIKLINSIFNDYTTHLNHFSEYRKIIKKEKSVFESDLKRILNRI